MVNELSGFEKSAPTNRPSTKGQNPVSAWDVDLSPFHRLVEQQVGSTRQLLDIFSHKMEELINLQREDKRQGDKQNQSLQEALIQSQKAYHREFAVVRDNIAELESDVKKNHLMLKDRLEQCAESLENIQNNTYNLIRPIKAQENLLREGFTPTQFLQPLEKLSHIQETTSESLEQLTHSWRSFQESQEAYQKKLLEEISKRDGVLDSLEKTLLSLGTQLQGTEGQNLPLERMEKLLQQNCEILEKQYQNKQQREQKENLFFWGFIGIATFLFIFLLATK